MADPADPDDWRPNSAWAIVGDPDADVAVIAERIAPGDAIPLHTHRIDEVVIYLSGAGELTLDDATFDVRSGDIVVIPASRIHGTRNTGSDVIELRAIFPSARVDMTYVERNAAPGTEADAPRRDVIWDTRARSVDDL
jgi:quercetin dioxygenase-like cupin family protein